MHLLSLLLLQDAPAPLAEPALDQGGPPPEAPADPAACPAAREATLQTGPRPHKQAKEALEAWAFPSLTPDQEEAREGIRTDGLVVLHQGQLVYERYDRGYTEDSPHLLWSATKTWTNALAGIAVQQGKLDIDASICEHIEVGLPEHCDITPRHLMEFSSGLDWRETYEGDPPTTSTVIAMLYGAGRDDMAAYVLSTPRRAEPGTTWQYSSGDTNVLAAVVQAALGEEDPEELLLGPLQLDSAVWERDERGTLVGSSYGYATPRDMARFGLFLADDGCWEGQRLLPEGWLEQSRAPAPTLRLATLDRRPGDVNGWQMWLNRALPEQGEPMGPWPSAPEDTFAAMGHWKQAILVIPSADMVIVRTGDDRDGSFSWDTLLAHSLALVGHQVAMPGFEAAALTARNSDSESRKEETGLLGIGAAYGAKLACSCAFVMDRDEDFCRAWIRASPDIVNVRFDHEERRVSARALGMVKTTASWRGPRAGCTLDP